MTCMDWAFASPHANALLDTQPFEAWLTADLRNRFGEPERLPEEWVRLVQAVDSQT